MLDLSFHSRSVQTVLTFSLLLLPSSPPFQFRSNIVQFEFTFTSPSMVNPAIARFSILLLFLFSTLVNITVSAESPAPAPHSSADSPDAAPNSSAGSPSHAAPTPNPSPASSPDAPISAPPHPDSPPAPTPDSSPSPSPSPAGKDDDGTNHTDVGDLNGVSSGGGMSSGKKAGIAVGVIAAVSVVALGALVYKKRRQNIERSQYGSAARRELL